MSNKLPPSSPREFLRSGSTGEEITINPRTLPRTGKYTKLVQRWMNAPLLSVKRAPYAQQGWCYLNVQEHCLRHGGEVVLGWQMLIEANAFICAVHHAIWRSPDGELIDIRLLDANDDGNATFVVDHEPLQFRAQAGATGVTWAETKMPCYLPIGPDKEFSRRLIVEQLKQHSEEAPIVPVLSSFAGKLVQLPPGMKAPTSDHDPFDVIEWLRAPGNMKDVLTALGPLSAPQPVSTGSSPAPPGDGSAGVVADHSVIDDAFVANLRAKAATVPTGRRLAQAQVPCASCTLCCRGFWVPLMPGDDPSLYKSTMINGWRFLKRRPTGECVHLGRSGCKLHGKVPLPGACTSFDCRAMAENRPAKSDAMERFLEAVRRRGKSLGEPASSVDAGGRGQHEQLRLGHHNRT